MSAAVDYEAELEPAINLGEDESLSTLDYSEHPETWTTADGQHRLVGRDRELVSGAAADVGDLIANGHGFMVRSFSRVTELTTRCRYCRGPLPLPEAGWFCEFANRPWDGCCCNWCVIRDNHLLRNRGGQPTICQAGDCQRKAKAERQRRWRSKARERVDAESQCVEA